MFLISALAIELAALDMKVYVIIATRLVAIVVYEVPVKLLTPRPWFRSTTNPSSGGIWGQVSIKMLWIINGYLLSGLEGSSVCRFFRTGTVIVFMSCSDLALAILETYAKIN